MKRRMIAGVALVLAFGGCGGTESPTSVPPATSLPSVEGWAVHVDTPPCAGCAPGPARLGPMTPQGAYPIACLVDGAWLSCGSMTY